MTGPNSPTAPAALSRSPNGVPSSCRSRIIGRRVPMAVVVSARPTSRLLTTNPLSMSTAPTPRPRATVMDHPVSARLSGRPLSAEKSIS